MVYCTDYSIEDCIGLLSRKNIYDVFEYSFELKTETSGRITFIYSNKHPWAVRAPIRAIYTIEFKKSNKTIIDIEPADECFSILPQKYITEFMQQKLDAVEMLEEDDTSGSLGTYPKARLGGEMNRTIRIVVVIMLCVGLIPIMRTLLGLSFLSVINLATRSNEQTDSQIQEVETFFQGKGYDEIHIIGANTNGREHGVPFSYNWYWHSFELGEKGEEVVVLYHYRDVKEIDKYLAELDDDTRNKCYVSPHFVFYYGGEDEDITDAIIEFCEENRAD